MVKGQFKILKHKKFYLTGYLSKISLNSIEKFGKNLLKNICLIYKKKSFFSKKNKFIYNLYLNLQFKLD